MSFIEFIDQNETVCRFQIENPLILSEQKHWKQQPFIYLALTKNKKRKKKKTGRNFIIHTGQAMETEKGDVSTK